MKAKELAEILLKNPDAIVMQEVYTGCDTPCIEIKRVGFYEAHKPFENEGGEHIKGDRNGIPKKDVIVLYPYTK